MIWPDNDEASNYFDPSTIADWALTAIQDCNGVPVMYQHWQFRGTLHDSGDPAYWGTVEDALTAVLT